MTESIWRIVCRYGNLATPVLLWVHGAEAEKWDRRLFNFDPNSATYPQEIKEAKERSLARLALMGEIYSSKRVLTVFVSDWFRKSVAEVDTGISIENYVVIPNPIDTELFQFLPKDPNSRFSWLSLRPFASRKYANDLTVGAILALRNKEWFDKVRIKLIGHGPLFDDVVRPLRGMSNVELLDRFLSQGEIAREHKLHGIFLCPTRLDSQGVSMCEAMSSGLVPLTTNCSAIPEFVPKETGLLREPESIESLAEGLTELVENPSRFFALSNELSGLVRQKCGLETVIQTEIDAIDRWHPKMLVETPSGN